MTAPASGNASGRASAAPSSPFGAARCAQTCPDAAGVRQRTSIGGDRRCGQATDVDAAVWQALTAATVAPGAAAVGVRIADAAPQGGCPVADGGRRCQAHRRASVGAGWGSG